MKNTKIILILTILSIFLLNHNCFSRTIRKPSLIEQFIKAKEEKRPNKMVAEIMQSERGERLIQDLKERLKEVDINNLDLPFVMNDIQVPAGHGYEYEANIIIHKTTNKIVIIIKGDLELEGESEDPSCWNRLKVIKRCIIFALEESGMLIHKELNQTSPTPYYYTYYYKKS